MLGSLTLLSTFSKFSACHPNRPAGTGTCTNLRSSGRNGPVRPQPGTPTLWNTFLPDFQKPFTLRFEAWLLAELDALHERLNVQLWDTQAVSNLKITCDVSR